MIGEYPGSVALSARVATEELRQARTSGEHELGDLIEADLARAVGIVWAAASPMLKQSIIEHVKRGDAP